jgi:zinc protease
MPVVRFSQQAFIAVPCAKHSIPTPDKANATYTAGLVIDQSDRDTDHAALLLGTYILGGSSLSSRLGDRVRQKDGLSYGVGAFYSAGSEDKVARLAIFASCNPANVDKVHAAIGEELERLLKEGMPAEEFEKARQGILQSRARARSDDDYIANRLDRSLRVGDTLAYDAAMDKRFAELTREEVLAALKKHFDPKRLVVVTAGDFGTAGK